MAAHVRPEVLVEDRLDRGRADRLTELGDEHAVGGEQARVAGVVARVEVLGVVDEDLADLLAVLEDLQTCSIGHDRLPPSS